MAINRVVGQKSDFNKNSDFQTSQKLDPLQIDWLIMHILFTRGSVISRKDNLPKFRCYIFKRNE
jgi:hypothetical protein